MASRVFTEKKLNEAISVAIFTGTNGVVAEPSPLAGPFKILNIDVYSATGDDGKFLFKKDDGSGTSVTCLDVSGAVPTSASSHKGSEINFPMFEPGSNLVITSEGDAAELNWGAYTIKVFFDRKCRSSII